MKWFSSRSLITVMTFLTCIHISLNDWSTSNLSVVVTPLCSKDRLYATEWCSTLEDVSAKFNLSGSNNVTYLKMVLLQGTHIIVTELVLKGLDELVMVSNDTNTLIRCESTAALCLENIHRIKIQNLKFVGCLGNQFRLVSKLVIDECAFYGSDPVFNINESSTTIADSYINSSVKCTAMLTSISSNVYMYRTVLTAVRGAERLNSHGGMINIMEIIYNCATVQWHEDNVAALIELRRSTVILKNITITNFNRQVIMSAQHANIMIVNSSFSNNTGMILFEKSRISIKHTNITKNSGIFSLIYIFRAFCYITNSIISNNNGSILVRHSYVTFAGSNKIDNNVQWHNESRTNYLHIESIFTSVRSNVKIFGTATFLENHSKRYGGAIYASGSQISVHGNLDVVKNTAWEGGGGGAYLYLTELICYGNCTFSGNKAKTTGGGIHAVSSFISLRSSVKKFDSTGNNTMLFIANNEAMKGGGIYFEANSRINGLDGGSPGYNYSLVLTGNKAIKKGGAMFIDDSTYSGVCASVNTTHYQAKTECFLQTYEINCVDEVATPLYRRISFADNSAEDGSILYGGLFDRCTLNPVADMYSHFGRRCSIDGLTHFMKQSGLESKDEITSDAVRICFCQENRPNCTNNSPFINVTKGEEFTLSIVAVDQVDHPVVATVSAYVSPPSTLTEEQQLQKFNSTLNCTNVRCSISSTDNETTLGLYASDGPCTNKGPSMRKVNVHFKKCTCPIGFEPSKEPQNKCKCVCHQHLKSCISKCHNGLVKRHRNYWINYNKDKGYTVYQRCPYDYCKPPFKAHINLSDLDNQCAHGHSGFLCGACQPGFSVSMGTTHCIQCPKYWQAIMITYILAAAFSGLVIVMIVFVLNLTVAVGTINGLIFYANIVLANRRTFLPFEHPNFFTVFIALLNTEFHVDRCFYEGMDAYSKTWLALLPPLYLITLVVVIIIASKYSSKCTYLIGKRNPVAVLAMLILLSYTSMIRNIIDVFSSATITYNDGSHEKFWRVDPRIKYFQGKHIPLFLTALLLAILSLAYTVVLFCWQWLLKAPDTKLFRWIRNTKLNSFMDAYLAPYKDNYRFWTGFLLFSRIMVHFLLALNEAAHKQYDVLVVGIVVAIILILKACISDHLYKQSALDYIECMFYFNLLVLTLASYFSLNQITTPHKSQEIAARLSVTLTFITFLGIVFYHTHHTLSKHKSYNGVKLRVQHYCEMRNFRSSTSTFKFNRNFACSNKLSTTEVGLSDAFTDSSEVTTEDVPNETNRVHRIVNKLFKMSQRKKKFQASINSYNSVYLRESLLQELSNQNSV